MAQAQDIHVSVEDQAAFNEVMQLLEATPDTAEPTEIVNLGFTPNANDIPAKREKLAILFSSLRRNGRYRSRHLRTEKRAVFPGSNWHHYRRLFVVIHFRAALTYHQ